MKNEYSHVPETIDEGELYGFYCIFDSAHRKKHMYATTKFRECFLNLECEYVWEKQITEGNDHVVMCVKVVNICMDEGSFEEKKRGAMGRPVICITFIRPEIWKQETQKRGITSAFFRSIKTMRNCRRI